MGGTAATTSVARFKKGGITKSKSESTTTGKGDAGFVPRTTAPISIVTGGKGDGANFRKSPPPTVPPPSTTKDQWQWGAAAWNDQEWGEVEWSASAWEEQQWGTQAWAEAEWAEADWATARGA